MSGLTRREPLRTGRPLARKTPLRSGTPLVSYAGLERKPMVRTPPLRQAASSTRAREQRRLRARPLRAGGGAS